MQVAIRKIYHILDSGPPIQSAAIEAMYFCRTLTQKPSHAVDLPPNLQMLDTHFVNVATHTSYIELIIECLDRAFQKRRFKLHVTVQDVDIVASAMLIAKLRTYATTTLVRIHNLHDVDPELLRDLYRIVNRGTVRYDDFSSILGSY